MSTRHEPPSARLGPPPEIVRSVAAWRAIRRGVLKGQSIGFVPTMGALHEGHLALVERSLCENDRTLVSIFVNPTQFNDPNDLSRYPRPFEEDATMLGGVGAHFVIHPEASDLYQDHYRYRVTETELSRNLCGAHRPGHFEGMLTVVLKLLLAAEADRAYFGEKDFQQLELVRGMAQAFFLPTEIVGCPTVREPDGLAMSSRNRLLTPRDRLKAAEFPRFLNARMSAPEVADLLSRQGFEVDYIEDVGGRRFGAVRIGGVRLIDNQELKA